MCGFYLILSHFCPLGLVVLFSGAFLFQIFVSFVLFACLFKSSRVEKCPGSNLECSEPRAARWRTIISCLACLWYTYRFVHLVYTNTKYRWRTIISCLACLSCLWYTYTHTIISCLCCFSPLHIHGTSRKYRWHTIISCPACLWYNVVHGYKCVTHNNFLPSLPYLPLLLLVHIYTLRTIMSCLACLLSLHIHGTNCKYKRGKIISCLWYTYTHYARLPLASPSTMWCVAGIWMQMQHTSDASRLASLSSSKVWVSKGLPSG